MGRVKDDSLFKHESCGKCTPCREGTFWMEKVLHRLYHGHGTEQDLVNAGKCGKTGERQNVVCAGRICY
ncbi:MAG: NADH-ubiquinone oxidoreductase-F iron-sulfur binding region domain-containing protein [Chloroflexota bacterium]